MELSSVEEEHECFVPLFDLGSELLFESPEPGRGPRHGDTIDPLWNLFDLTPEGRGDHWYPDLTYS